MIFPCRPVDVYRRLQIRSCYHSINCEVTINFKHSMHIHDFDRVINNNYPIHVHGF